jgi:hypothetical protein
LFFHSLDAWAVRLEPSEPTVREFMLQFDDASGVTVNRWFWHMPVWGAFTHLFSLGHPTEIVKRGQ